MDAGAAVSVTRVTHPRPLKAGAPVQGFITPARRLNSDTPGALDAADAELRRQPFRF